MSMSRREINMAGFMLAALLILFAYLFTRSKLDGIDANRKGIATHQSTAQMRQNLIDQKVQVSLDLDRLVGQLPVYPMGKNVASELQGQIESMATKTGLTINKIEVKEDEELMTDGVYQMKISGTYDAPSAAVVKFLYLAQSKGGALDVSLYSHKPKLREPGMVEGSFIMDCAYRRKDLSKLPPAAPAGGPVRAAPPASSSSGAGAASPGTPATPGTPARFVSPARPGITTTRPAPGARPSPAARPASGSAPTAGPPSTTRAVLTPGATPPPRGIPPPSGGQIIRRSAGTSPLATPQTPPGLQRPTIQPTRVGTGTIVPAGTTAPASTIAPAGTTLNVRKANPLRPPSFPGTSAPATPAATTPSTPATSTGAGSRIPSLPALPTP